MPPTAKPSQAKSPGFNKSFREKYFGELDKLEGEKKKRKLVFSQVPKDGCHNRSIVNDTQHNATQNDHHPHDSTQKINSTYNSSLVSSPPQSACSPSESSNWRPSAKELLEKANDTIGESPSDRLLASSQENDPKAINESPVRAGTNFDEQPNLHSVPMNEIKLIHEHLEDRDDVGTISWDTSRDNHIDSDG
ncbi:uncharacterized protein LOC141857692 [Brevipalpus obovatus]|uniref:uncharacterized protein LOC141857692 n=1 Tax=Brevipalpus obovatus TaxID=246614 RepID=UPI003D9F8F77